MSRCTLAIASIGCIRMSLCRFLLLERPTIGRVLAHPRGSEERRHKRIGFDTCHQNFSRGSIRIRPVTRFPHLRCEPRAVAVMRGTAFFPLPRSPFPYHVFSVRRSPFPIHLCIVPGSPFNVSRSPFCIRSSHPVRLQLVRPKRRSSSSSGRRITTGRPCGHT